MKTNYEKLLELGKTNNITEKSIRNCLNCSKVDARLLYRELLRERAISNGKVINKDRFQRIALYRLVYDQYFAITVSLQAIIQNVLIDDENFIRFIQEHINPNFTAELSSEMRMNYLDVVLNQSDKDNYQIFQYVCQATTQMLQDNKDLLLSGNTTPEPSDKPGTIIMLDAPTHT